MQNRIKVPNNLFKEFDSSNKRSVLPKRAQVFGYAKLKTSDIFK